VKNVLVLDNFIPREMLAVRRCGADTKARPPSKALRNAASDSVNDDRFRPFEGAYRYILGTIIQGCAKRVQDKGSAKV
jgi:hypothetical protein